MPVISVSQKDINRQKPPEAGWHIVELTSCEEKASKDKGSINWSYEFEVKESDLEHGTNGDSTGRFCYHLVNSKATGMGLFPMQCALLDIKMDDITPGDIDTDKWFGKRCYVEIKDDVYEGKIQKRIVNWAPLSARPAF